MNNREAIEYASKYSFLALYEKGRADERPKAFSEGYDSGFEKGIAYVLKSIIECAEHLGYDDIEDLLSYVEEKEKNK